VFHASTQAGISVEKEKYEVHRIGNAVCSDRHGEIAAQRQGSVRVEHSGTDAAEPSRHLMSSSEERASRIAAAPERESCHMPASGESAVRIAPSSHILTQ
jgi:hypothetical protein